MQMHLTCLSAIMIVEPLHLCIWYYLNLEQKEMKGEGQQDGIPTTQKKTNTDND